MEKKFIKALAADILDKYGEEEGRKIINKMMNIEDVGGKPAYDKSVDILKSKISETPADLTEKFKVPDTSKNKFVDFHKTGEEFTDKITKLRALKKLGSNALKSLPIVGGIGAALIGDNVEASVPILEDIDSLNQTKEGSIDDMIENPGRYPEEERFKKLKSLYGKGKENE